MNKNLFANAAVSCLAVLCFAGCESDRTKIPAVVFREEVRALPEVHPLTEIQILNRAAAQPPPPLEGKGWQAMFDGESLNGWRVTGFSGRGPVECRNGLILLRAGDPLTGIHWTNEVPRTNYEITLEAMRVGGMDCFCGLTFPVGDSFCCLF